MILAIILILTIVTAISTGILAVTLLVFGEELNKEVLLKCLGIVVAATLAGIVPGFSFLAIFVFFGGVMLVFEKSFFEALLIGIVCTALQMAVRTGVAAAIGSML